MNAQRKTQVEAMIKIRDEIDKEVNNMETSKNGLSPTDYAHKCGQLTMINYILKRFYNVEENT